MDFSFFNLKSFVSFNLKSFVKLIKFKILFFRKVDDFFFEICLRANEGCNSKDCNERGLCVDEKKFKNEKKIKNSKMKISSIVSL